MGNTTVIELNHDYCMEIENNPERFIEQILAQIRSFRYDNQPINGGHVICSFNRDGGYLDSKWEAFKGSLALERARIQRMEREID